MNDLEWDDAKADANLRKQDVSFELATSVFNLWNQTDNGMLRIRLITARKSTTTEIRQYRGANE